MSFQRWPIRWVAFADTAPHPRNPQEHDPAEQQRLHGSLDEHGVLEPPCWNERSGYLIGGHDRVRQMQDAGEDGTEMIVADFDTEQELAALLALNGTYGHKHRRRTYDILSDLDAAGYDLDLTGLEPYEIESIMEFPDDPDDRRRKKQKDKPSSSAGEPDKWLVIVSCVDEETQNDLMVEMLDRGLTCRAHIS